MSVEPTPSSRRPSCVPHETIDLVWPPPDRDIDAITVIDLEAPTDLGRTRGWQNQPVLSQGLVLYGPDRPAERRRIHVLALIVGLITVELVSSRVGQPSRAEAVAPLAAFPIARAWLPPSAMPMKRMSPEPARVARPTGHPARHARATEVRRAPLQRTVRTVPRPTVMARGEHAPAPEVLSSTSKGRLEADLAPARHEFVPARIIESPKPRHVPSTFPTPRGAHTDLELVIDERGRVASARVASSGAGFYDAPLLAAARTWRFEPARTDGRPTRSVQTIQVAVP